jgi:hypothetical protein
MLKTMRLRRRTRMMRLKMTKLNKKVNIAM